MNARPKIPKPAKPTEADRLRAKADDMDERLQALLRRREDALDRGHPGPSAETIDHAEKLAKAARAAADGAARSREARRARHG